METNPLYAFAEMWTRAFDIKGRTRRATFWWSVILDSILVTLLLGLGPVGLVYHVLSIVPGITMMIRRLHDIDRKGWWLLLALIPFGGIVVLIFFFMDSTGANRFGDSPKYGNVPF